MKVKDLKGILTGRVVIEIIESNGIRHGYRTYLTRDFYGKGISPLLNCEVISITTEEDSVTQIVVRRAKREIKITN